MVIVEDEEMGGDARIEGTRIAVYHVMDYVEAGYSPEEIADEFGLDVYEIEAAVEYAEE